MSLVMFHARTLYHKRVSLSIEFQRIEALFVACERGCNFFHSPFFQSVQGMAQFLRVKVLSRVFTAKRSEPQAAASNGRRGGSGVAKPASLRTDFAVSLKTDS